MNDINSVAGTSHIARKGSSAVKPCLEPAYHRQAHQPSIEAVERTTQILRRCVVLPESGDNQHSASDNSTHYQRNPGFLQFFLYLVVREHEIAQQEGNQVKKRLVQVQEAIETFWTRILDECLLTRPKQHA